MRVPEYWAMVLRPASKILVENESLRVNIPKYLGLRYTPSIRVASEVIKDL